MPLQSTSGAASYDAFGGGAAAKVNYIEDFFQSYLRTGTGASATVTTGLDGSTKETLVWTKSRSAATNHKLTDNVRGATKALSSNTVVGETTDSQGLTAFSATGYTIGTNTDYNNSGATYVDWQLVSQPKFFDVVNWIGNGTAGRTISHNLGSTPGCIIVKNLFSDREWAVYHRSNGGTPQNNFLRLNTTKASVASSIMWNNTAPTDTTFTVGSGLYEDTGSGDYTSTNESGDPYVAYLFAHDAGGFGLTGTDNVISCGSFTTDGSGNATVSLGYEPQWLLTKSSSGTSSWMLLDNMRGWVSGAGDYPLYANLTNAEGASTSQTAGDPTATGFTTVLNPSATYIYIAIRRGPMKVPTLGTSVFEPINAAGSTGTKLTTNFPVDAQIWMTISDGVRPRMVDRLRGVSTNSTSYGVSLFTNSTDAEDRTDQSTRAFDNTGFTIPGNFLGSGINAIYWNFKRAPGFFDEVCYVGTGADPQTVSHNLGVAPELMIFKARAVAAGWRVWGGNMAITEYLALSETSAVVTGSTFFGSTLPTATSFYVGSGLSVSARTHVAYLFATCAGVSKVFSYTGNGSSQTINCGFTGGARWILIKRTDSTGDWYVWDSARGIVSGNDPHLSLNTTAAEVTTDDTIDTDSTGFVVNQVSATNVNVSSATYIGLAIA